MIGVHLNSQTIQKNYSIPKSWWRGMRIKMQVNILDNSWRGFNLVTFCSRESWQSNKVDNLGNYVGRVRKIALLQDEDYWHISTLKVRRNKVSQCTLWDGNCTRERLNYATLLSAAPSPRSIQRHFPYTVVYLTARFLMQCKLMLTNCLPPPPQPSYIMCVCVYTHTRAMAFPQTRNECRRSETEFALFAQ